MARYMFVRDVFTKDGTWTVPKAFNQEFEVSVWGAGGAGSISSFEEPISGAGGGSGYFNRGNFVINAGEQVEMQVGQGGQGCSGTDAGSFVNAYVGASGGTTRFGNYIYAEGGQGGNYDQGGIGGQNGGAPGCDGEGNYAGYGIMNECNGVFYMSGGGAAGMYARGTGGAANMAAGDAGTGGGGAGALVTSVDSAGIHRRTGSGGPGVISIQYYRYLGE